MANVSTDEDTQTCVIGTTHTLYSGSAEGNYVLVLDFNNAADGDWFEVTVEEKVLTGGSVRQVGEPIVFVGDQDGAIWKSDPYDSVYGLVFKLLQRAGTGRDIPWRVTELG